MPDVFVELRATISEFSAKMAEARKEMEKTEKAGTSHFGALSKFGAGAFAALGAGAVTGVAVAIKAGSELEDSHAGLVKAVENTGAKYKAFAAPVGVADKAMEKFGFTNAQTEAALMAGTTATGSAKKALDLLQVAADVAAVKHVDLSTAMIAVAKGSEGNLRPLKQMGIDLPLVASSAEKVKVAQQHVATAQANLNDLLKKFPDAANPASKAHAKYETALGKVRDAQAKLNDLTHTGTGVIDALRQRMGGQAAAAADTFGGKMKAARAQIEDVAAKIGEKLIPIIMKVVGWMSQHKSIVVAGIMAIVGAFGLMAAAAAVAFIAENAATLGIAAGITVLVGGIIYLATHWHKVWTDIKHWFDDAVKFLRGGLGTLILALLGPIGWLGILALHWQQIWRDIKAWTLDAVRAIVGFFTQMGHDIVNWGSHAVTWLVQIGKDIMNGLAAGIKWPWDNVIKPFFKGIAGAAGAIGGFFVDAYNWLGKAGRAVLNGLWAGLKWVWDNVLVPNLKIWTGAAGAIVGFFNDAVHWLYQRGRDILQGLWNGLKWVYDNVIVPNLRFWTGAAGAIANFFTGAVNWLYQRGRDLLNGLWNGISWVFTNIISPGLRFFTGVGGAIARVFDGAVNWLVQAGKDIVNGLYNGITSILKDAYNWVKNNIFDPIKNAVFSLFGFGSPSKEAEGWGQHIMAGFVKGLILKNPLSAAKAMIGDIPKFLKHLFLSHIPLLGSLLGGGGGGGGLKGPPVGAAAAAAVLTGSNAAVAQQAAAFIGWTGAEWTALNNLVMRESGWSMTATNPTSGAYGIAQGITGPSWYYQWPGGDPNTLMGQLNGLFAYIKSRYGDPINAWAHEVSAGWYDRGGILPPGLTLALNTSGRNEYVVGAGSPSAGTTIVLQVDGKTLGNVVLTQLLQEQQRRPLGLKTT
jgi:hypothetical protein